MYVFRCLGRPREFCEKGRGLRKKIFGQRGMGVVGFWFVPWLLEFSLRIVNV